MGRFAHPSSRYLALFDAAQPKFSADEVEFDITLDDDELTVALPSADGEIPREAVEAAREILAQLGELDALATAFLFELPGWPYGRDARLWLLLVQPDNVRFCYAQASVNDEQVVGFARQGGEWTLIGHDSRFRAKG